MKCERCQKNPAVARIDQIVNGRREAHFLCQSCAEELMGVAMNQMGGSEDAGEPAGFPFGFFTGFAGLPFLASGRPSNHRRRCIRATRAAPSEPSTFFTVCGCQLPPLAVAIPRALSASAIPASVPIPLATMPAMIGATAKAKPSAFARTAA